jgi:hypothetical protein
MRGGPNRGQGRKPLKEGETTFVVSVRLAQSQRAKLALLGGAKWIRAMIERATNG